MKLLTKIVAAVAVAGVGATMYAAPGIIAGDGSLGSMMGQAQNIKGEMAADYGQVLDFQRVARKDKDIIKLTCVNDKLVSIKPELNIADQAMLQLNSSAGAAGAKSSFDAIAEAGQAVHGLREGAEQCLGERSLLTETSNDYTHPDIPDSPGNNPYNGQWSIEPPAYASPVN